MALTKTDTLNYRGELFNIGANQTPFLNIAGGLSSGKRSASFTFPVAQPWSLNAAAQTVQSEDTAAAAGTPTTYARAQDYNTCQIMKYDAAVTFKKQADSGTFSGLNINSSAGVITNELAFQKAAALRQMAIDVEYSFLQGTYQAAANTATAGQTRGIITAATTNTVAAGGATLDHDLINELMRTMAANGSVFQNPVIFVNAFQLQKISQIFGSAPYDRFVGGVAVRTIITDFATIGVVWAPKMPTSTLLVADMSVVSPVFQPVSFNGEDFGADAVAGVDVLWVPTAITAAQKGGFLYAHVGLDYGPEEYHGTITGLATA